MEPTIEESIIDDSQLIDEDDDGDILEKNLIDNKENDEIESINEDPSSIIEGKISCFINNNKVSSKVCKSLTKFICDFSDETIPQHTTINEASSEDDENYDNSVMMKAINASLPKQSLITENDEPIALDDSESECSSIIDEQEDDSFLSLNKRMMRYNPKFFFARGLVKKSIRILLRQAKGIRNEKQLITKKYDNDENSVQLSDIDENNVSQPTTFVENINVEKKVTINDPQNVIKMDNLDDEKKLSNGNEASKLDVHIDKKINHKECVGDKSDPENMHDDIEDKTKVINNLESTNAVEIKSLLNEIACSSIDEIMSRHIIRSSENNSVISVDDFSEQLFYCLQENKKEIENIQRLWNEKVHLKFKMREIMERIRRQRVVSEIETFGLKHSQDVQQFHLLSSKSSTTNSTENEHFERSSKLSSQSVNRLIQDVRENVLKKEKHKIADMVSNNINENYEDCTSFGINSNMFQTSLSQGRQGQTIDVQSIINDFRQKNPQEIPRRGRRMKSSFPNNYFMSNQIQTQYIKGDDDKINNSTLDHNSAKSNSSVGFPEVSLLPVNNYYKTHSPQYGQKSSLLQSILTKVFFVCFVFFYQYYEYLNFDEILLFFSVIINNSSRIKIH